MIKNLIHLGLTLGIILSMTTTVYAKTDDFTIYPTYKHGENTSWIIQNIAPGQKVKDFVTLENLSSEQQTLRIEYSEAEDKGDEFVPKSLEEKDNIGLWTTLQTGSYTLAPHEKIKIPVEFFIPEDAAFGKYSGAIYAVEEFKNQQDINVAVRIGVRTYINVVSPDTAGQTNIFISPVYVQNVFYLFSLIALIAAIFYNLIFIIEKKKYVKKHA